MRTFLSSFSGQWWAGWISGVLAVCAGICLRHLVETIAAGIRFGRELEREHEARQASALQYLADLRESESIWAELHREEN